MDRDRDRDRDRGAGSSHDEVDFEDSINFRAWGIRMGVGHFRQKASALGLQR